MLEELELESSYAGRDQVAILVGPNGSGKSNYLRGLAVGLRTKRDLLVISNTAYDRFSGLRGLKRVSASRSGRSPKSVLSRAVARALDAAESRFYEIGKTLAYCGYEPRVGFLPVALRSPDFDVPAHDIDREFRDSIEILMRYSSAEILWIDERESAFGFSRAREFASVLNHEARLRADGFLKDIKVFLTRRDGIDIELLSASSGELSLISNLVFLASTSKEGSVILIDEPENSLHPSWQREYVDKVLEAVAYRGSTIVIATHAPLIVTGALVNYAHFLSVWQVEGGKPKRLKLIDPKRSAANIEGVLWRAFDVITPANHFVSEEVANIVAEVEQGTLTSDAAVAKVNAMDAQSFDSRQQEFFGAVRELIAKVDKGRRDTPDA